MESVAARVAVGAKIWVRDLKGEDVWLRGEVIDMKHYRLCDDVVNDRLIEIPEEFLICNDGADDVDDLTQLTHLHEASLLESLHKRFDVDSIYTYTGPILIAVNPFKRISGLYDQDILDEFIRHSQDTTYLQADRKPHVFATALEAYRGLCAFKKNQTVLISGESGAGKTESTKFVMKLLALAGTTQHGVGSGHGGSGYGGHPGGGTTTGGGGVPSAGSGAAKAKAFSKKGKSSTIRSTSSVMTTTIDMNESPPAVDSKGQQAPISTSSVENQVLQSNPLLEAFGNAKTLRNDNSSRFGKFIEMEFVVNSTTELGRLCGAKIHTYLLETVRVCRQLLNERNFHAFYQLSAAVVEAQKNGGSLSITPELNYDFSMFDDLLSNRYVSCSGCVSLPNLDELSEFKQTCIAMSTVNISLSEQHEMWKLVGAILLLGSIYFYSTTREAETCKIDESMETVLMHVANLLGVDDPENLRRCLTSRTIVVQKEKYNKGLTRDQAEDARDALAKALYHTLFQRIVAATNKSIQAPGAAQMIVSDTPTDSSTPQLDSSPETTTTTLNTSATAPPAQSSNPAARSCDTAVSCGVLDIFGFECFEVNSFEQLCINYTNERLQSFFNNYIFSCEEKLYRAENIQWDTLDFPDNSDCVDLIANTANNKMCILSLLDEECVIPKGNDQNLCNKFKTNFKAHKRFKEIKTRQDWFIVNHFAGNVSYCVKGFIDKNKDQLGQDIQDCIKASSNEFISMLFNNHLEREPQVPAGGKAKKKQLLTVSLEFRNQLNSLMETISKTEPHFVRCVKPNPQNKPNIFNRKAVAEQLRYAGVLQAVQVSRAGYPVRDTHLQFWQLYNCLTDKKVRAHACALADRERAQYTIDHLDEKFHIPKAKHGDGKSWAVGNTLVFLKHEAYEVLSTRRAELRHSCARIIQAQWLGGRTRKWYHAALAAIITIQCAVRSAQARAKATELRRRRAGLMLTRVARGFLARRLLRKKAQCITKIQKRIRGVLARDYVKNLKRHRAATRIQTQYRAHRARVWYKKSIASIIAIQLRWKRYYARQLLARLRAESRNTSNLQGKISQLQNELQALRAQCATLTEEKANLEATVAHNAEIAKAQETVLTEKAEALKRAETAEALLAEKETALLLAIEAKAEAENSVTIYKRMIDTEQQMRESLAREASHATSPIPPAVREMMATQTSPTAQTPIKSIIQESPVEELEARIEAEVSKRLNMVGPEMESELERLRNELADAREKLAQDPVKAVRVSEEAPFTPAVGTPSANQTSSSDTREGAEAITRTSTPSSPENNWAREKEQLMLDLQALREDVTRSRDALDFKIGGSEDYLECVLNVLSAGSTVRSPKSGGTPTAVDHSNYQLLCDVLFVTQRPDALAALLLSSMKPQLAWDELNLERLNNLIITGSDPQATENAEIKPIEFLFPHVSITSLKAFIVTPEHIRQLTEGSCHQRIFKNLRAALFYPALISHNDASMKLAWDSIGLSASRMLLIHPEVEPNLSTSLEICSNTYGIVTEVPRLPNLLTNLCEVANRNRVNLVRDLQELKETLRVKANQSSKVKPSKMSPISELMSLIPTIFTGGAMRGSNRVMLPPGMSSKSQAPQPILEPTLGEDQKSGETNLICPWQDLRVPNGAAVTSVCFAPIEFTREFHLLCAATKSGLIYTYRVPFTPAEREKVQSMNLPPLNTELDPAWTQPCTTIRLWRVLEGHERAITSMFFTREGDFLITTSVDCSVRFWDYVTGYPAKIFSDSVPILTARIMPTNPKCFFTSNSKSVVRLVNIEEGRVIQRVKVDSEIRAVCFDSSGLNMLAGTKDGCIATYEVAEDTKLRFIDKINISHATNNSGKSAVTCVQFVRGNPPHIVVNLSDNSIVICGVYYGLTNCCVSQVVLKKRIKNPHSCLPLTTCSIRRDELSMCISPSEDNKLKVISSAADFDVVEELKGHSCPTLSVGCTPNKTLLASADVAGFIKLWRS